MSDALTTEQMVELVRQRGWFATKNPNRYDRGDMVAQTHMLRAGPMKLAAYKVRDPETLEWSKTQFHMTYDNTVMAFMGEEAAKLFARFVTDTLAREEP